MNWGELQKSLPQFLVLSFVKEHFKFSRNLLWVILSLYDTFHAETSYSKVGFTLNRLSFILPAVVLSCSFVARKNQSARHKQKQSFCVLLTSRKRHSSVTPGASTLLCKAKASVVANIARPQWCHSMLVAGIHALRNLCGSAL